MKKKFLVLTLCFTLIFSSLNYKRSYADGGVISLPILATVSSLAVGACIVINNIDDLYDLGRLFYDYIDGRNDLTWSTVSTAFIASTSLVGNVVSVESDFLDIVKGFFDDTFDEDIDVSYVHGIPTLPYSDRFYAYSKSVKYPHDSFPIRDDFNWGSVTFKYIGNSSYDVLFNGNSIIKGHSLDLNYWGTLDLGLVIIDGMLQVVDSKNNGFSWTYVADSVSSVTFPYNGGYNWDNVESKKENESVALPIPGDLGQLVGQGSTDFWDNTDGLVGQGGLTLPGVDSPSIGVDSSVNTFPSVDSDVPGVDSPSVPNDGIWSSIKDFIIGLVVPSDTYWTDTWGGLYNNFTNSFPMVDMDGFNDLVTGEKKFPNIDINIMGVNGRVVNGDVVNSIVDWLRPIVAGFVMLCLMFFNYRKIYKLIRNSEPFEGIGKVENHAN